LETIIISSEILLQHLLNYYFKNFFFNINFKKMSRFIRTACAIAVAAQFEAQVLTPVSAMCGCGGEDTTVSNRSEAEQEELRNEVAKKNKEAEEARLAAEKGAEERATRRLTLEKELLELHDVESRGSGVSDDEEQAERATENAADRQKIEELEAKLRALDSQEKQDEKKLAKIRAEAAEAYAAAREAGVPDSAEVQQLKTDVRAKLQEKMQKENEGKDISEEEQEFQDMMIKGSDNLSEEQLQRLMSAMSAEDKKKPDADIMKVLAFDPIKSKIMSCTDEKQLKEVLTKEPFKLKEKDFEQKFASMDLAQIQEVFLKTMEFNMMSPEERNEEIMKINDKDEFIMFMKNGVFGFEFSNENMLGLAGILSLDEIKSVLKHEVLARDLVKQKVMACEKKNEIIEMEKELHLYDEEDRKEFESMSFEELQAMIVKRVAPSPHAIPVRSRFMPRHDSALDEGFDGDAMLPAHAAQHSRHAVDAQGEYHSGEEERKDSDRDSRELRSCTVRHHGRGASADLPCADPLTIPMVRGGDVAPQRLGACRIAHSRFRGSPRGGAMVCDEGEQGYAIMCEPEPMWEPSVAVGGH